jgi:hypothetical protein
VSVATEPLLAVQQWLGQADSRYAELLAHRDSLLSERHEIDAKLVVTDGMLAQIERALGKPKTKKAKPRRVRSDKGKSRKTRPDSTADVDGPAP